MAARFDILDVRSIECMAVFRISSLCIIRVKDFKYIEAYMLTREIIEKIIKVLQPHHPEMIGVFGSYARGESASSSDIDILVHFKNPIGLIKLVGLQQLLSAELGIEVDLITKNSLQNPRLKEYILRDLITIFNEEGQPHLS